MAKKQGKQNKQELKGGDAEALVKAFLSMRNSVEMKAFLRDLLTESELVEFAKRYRAARSIAKSIHYDVIEEETGLSSRTIARVKQWYKHGKGGYQLAIRRSKS